MKRLLIGGLFDRRPRRCRSPRLSPGRVREEWSAAMTSALLSSLVIALTLGILAVSAPAGAAEGVSSPTLTIRLTPPAGHGTGIMRGSLVTAIESPATDQQLHTD